MVREAGIESVGFLTLTVGDTLPGGTFQQIHDHAEASRRVNNLNRRVLRDLFERAVIVTERHKNGAIHFHAVGVIRGRPDIRTGFNWEAVGRRDYRSAPLALRHRWEFLRDKLPEYGFGRSELTPIRKGGEEIASYVSKYVSKHLESRTPDDKRKKLVRYLGWEKAQLKPNEFSWASERARAWRWKARAAASVIGCHTRENCADALGPRWAFLLTSGWVTICGDDQLPYLDLSGFKLAMMYDWLVRHAKGWRIHNRPRVIDEETVLDANQHFEGRGLGGLRGGWMGLGNSVLAGNRVKRCHSMTSSATSGFRGLVPGVGGAPTGRLCQTIRILQT
jgi:hypothetical protein